VRTTRAAAAAGVVGAIPGVSVVVIVVLLEDAGQSRLRFGPCPDPGVMSEVSEVCTNCRNRSSRTKPDYSGGPMTQSPADGSDASVHLPADPRAFPPVLTAAMAAELLQVHVEYLRKMVREGRVPAHRFPGGRELRFLRDELIAWLGALPGPDPGQATRTQRSATNGR
jgi:excisionase family DNA binding protein